MMVKLWNHEIENQSKPSLCVSCVASENFVRTLFQVFLDRNLYGKDCTENVIRPNRFNEKCRENGRKLFIRINLHVAPKFT